MGYKKIFEIKKEKFLKAVENYIKEQESVLHKIIVSNKNTEFGRRYNFEQIHSVQDYQKNVPVSVYEDYVEYIDKIKLGNKNILTEEDIILLEPTGGSSAGSKYIPYTNSLKQSFNLGIEPWLSDLFLNYPEILKKPMYWSITPSSKMQYCESQIPVGFESDMEYLNSPFSDIISNLIILPDINKCNNDNFYEVTLNELKKHKNLAFISVWNPTLLLNIIDKVQNPHKIWKDLNIISCWDEANAVFYADKLRKKFPNTHIQGKGLLATEGIMTVPILNIGKVPCVSSHFFEFIDIKTNEVKLLHELELEKEYLILLTTQGGLYRYKIGDIVKVYATYKDCPLLSFVGREDNISDYFGEKLNETFVHNILTEVINSDTSDEFYLFAPCEDDGEFYYVLYYECNKEMDIDLLSAIIEEKLQENYHYKYAGELNQIKRFRVKAVKNGQKQYLDNCVRKGQKLGDIKPIMFSKNKDWNFKTEELL